MDSVHIQNSRKDTEIWANPQLLQFVSKFAQCDHSLGPDFKCIFDFTKVRRENPVSRIFLYHSWPLSIIVLPVCERYSFQS